MRCPTCYRPADATHRLLGRCPSPPEPPRATSSRSRAGYVPPCRRDRPSRAEYDAQRATTPERKRELTNARAARYRARRKAAA